jgi:hypothetical protein
VHPRQLLLLLFVAVLAATAACSSGGKRSSASRPATTASTASTTTTTGVGAATTASTAPAATTPPPAGSVTFKGAILAVDTRTRVLAIEVPKSPQGVVLVVVGDTPITGGFHSLDQLKRPNMVTVVAIASTVDGVTSYRAVSVVADAPSPSTTNPNKSRSPRKDRTSTTAAAK